MATFGDIFRQQRTIVLDEPDSAPLGWIETLDVMPDGRIIVANRMSSRVRVHGRDGRLESVVGREGQGPGEFDGLIDLAVLPDGCFLTAESRQNRLTRFTANGQLEATPWTVGVFTLRRDSRNVGH